MTLAPSTGQRATWHTSPYDMLHAPATLKKEILLALWLVGSGFFALPPAVYWVGQQVVGEYEGGEGVWGMTLDLWSGVVSANPMALLLVSSPYFIIQTLRISRRLRREN